MCWAQREMTGLYIFVYMCEYICDQQQLFFGETHVPKIEILSICEWSKDCYIYFL